MATKTREEKERELAAQTAQWVDTKGAPMLFAPVSMQQFATSQDIPAKGPIWVSRDTFPSPSSSFRRFFCTSFKSTITRAINDLKIANERVDDFTVEDVRIQWSGYRPDAAAKEPEPDMPEEEKFERLMKDVKNDVTLLYAHGGFFYTGSPATTRHLQLGLARESGGRCCAVDYRLAPQKPFPAAIVDLLVAYLTLLYPGKGARHAPVEPGKLVLAGESSGGNMVLSLLALLTWLRDHNGGQIEWQGQKVSVPLPAGIATLSAYCDFSMSFDSHTRHKAYDIFVLDLLPYLSPTFPACDLWPTTPPREEIYCHGSALCHPLVSPAISPTFAASNLPPMFFAYGQEKLTDEGYYLAQKARRAGTRVHFAMYDALPHIFPVLFPGLPQSSHVMRAWGAFCRDVVLGVQGESATGTFVRYRVDDEEFRGEELVLPVGEEEAERRTKMLERIAARKVWTGPREEKL